jgi:hypothetical protein
MPLKKHDGILVGRPAQGKNTFNFGIIPKDDDSVDMLEIALPTQLYGEVLVVNSKRARRLLKNLYLVEYIRRDAPSAKGGFITYADVIDIKKRIPLDKLEEQVKEIDSMSEIIKFKEEVDIDETFILDLSNTLGTGAKLPKRFYSTQVVLKVNVNDTVHTVMMPLKEVIAFLQDNPGMIKGLIVLPSYHFGIILTSEVIPETVFKEDILDQISLSLLTFDKLLDVATREAASTAEE